MGAFLSASEIAQDVTVRGAPLFFPTCPLLFWTGPLICVDPKGGLLVTLRRDRVRRKKKNDR